MKSFVFGLCILLILNQEIQSTTLVYNMKIRRAITLGTQLKDNTKNFWLLSAVPIIYKKDRHIVDNRLFVIDVKDKRLLFGSLCNLRYNHSKYWWLEATTGFLKEQVKSSGTREFYASRCGCDDIVLSGGYHIYLHKNIQGAFYGLAGFPTKLRLNLNDIQDPLVGSRLFGIGLGTELSGILIKRSQGTLLYIFQGRILHFFKRTWKPIFPADVKLKLGNVMDFLCGLKYQKENHMFDIGYNSTIYTNQAIKLPMQDLHEKTLVRNSFYVTYLHAWVKTPIKKPIALGAGFLCASSKTIRTHIYSIFLNFNVLF